MRPLVTVQNERPRGCPGVRCTTLTKQVYLTGRTREREKFPLDQFVPNSHTNETELISIIVVNDVYWSQFVPIVCISNATIRDATYNLHVLV